MLQKITKTTFLFAVICSILSQLPFLLQTNVASLLKLSWLLPLFCCLILYPKRMFPKALESFFIFVFVFFFYCLLLENFTIITYFGTDFTNICYSLGICMISYAIWFNVGDQKFLNQIALCSLITSLVLGFFIYRDFLAGADLATRTYAYASKNSAAQIFLNCIILFLGAKLTNKATNVTALIIVFLLLVEIFLMKSRATMVGFVIVLLYLNFFTKDKKLRNIVRCLLLICIAYFIYNSKLFDSIINDMVLGNRDASNLNDVSSGRVTMIDGALAEFRTSQWFGVGNLYVDCFPVSILTQYGIVGFVIVFSFIIYLIKESCFKIKATTPLYMTDMLLVITILANSLFEAQPPFGPGMKCFIVWMVFGFSLASYTKSSKSVKRLKYCSI